MSYYLGKDLDLRMMKVSRRRFPSLSWPSLPSQKESSFFETSASFSLSCTLIATYRMFVGSLLSLLCSFASSTEPTRNPNLIWEKTCVKGCLYCSTLTLNPQHCQAHSRRVQKCCRSRKGTLQRCRRQRWLQCAGTRQRSRGRAKS